MSWRPAVATVLAIPVLSAWGCADEVPSQSAQSSPSAPTGPSGPDAGRTTASPVAPARRAPTAQAAEAPRVAVLPSGRSVAIRAVGTTTAGVLDVPDDVDIAGWWRGGSRLGDPFGSMLVAAHVDSATQGLGPFAELLDVTAGARIEVRSRSRRQAFEVRSRELVPRTGLTDHPSVFDASGQARLVLVTCAPPYDPASGGYQNLAVVTAVPVGPP